MKKNKQLDVSLLEDLKFVSGIGRTLEDSVCIMSACQLLLGYSNQPREESFMAWQRHIGRVDNLSCCCPALQTLVIRTNDVGFDMESDRNDARKRWALDLIPRLINSYAGPAVTMHRLLDFHARWINRLGSMAPAFQKVTTPTLGELEAIFGYESGIKDWQTLRTAYLAMHSRHFKNAFLFIKETLKVEEELTSLLSLNSRYGWRTTTHSNFKWTVKRLAHTPEVAAAWSVAFSLEESKGKMELLPSGSFGSFIGPKDKRYHAAERSNALSLCDSVRDDSQKLFSPNIGWNGWLGYGQPTESAAGKIEYEALSRHGMKRTDRVDMIKGVINEWAVPADN